MRKGKEGKGGEREGGRLEGKEKKRKKDRSPSLRVTMWEKLEVNRKTALERGCGHRNLYGLALSSLVLTDLTGQEQSGKQERSLDHHGEKEPVQNFTKERGSVSMLY